MKVLIAYYSRTGNSKRIASLLKEIFEELPGVFTQIESIVDLKNRTGVGGYAIGGRDAAMKKLTDITPPMNDAGNFDMVIIGGPVWAWTVSPAIRTYCSDQGRKARKIAFFCTMGGSGDKRAFSEMERLCGKPPRSVLSLTDGMIKKGGPALKEILKEFSIKCLK